MFPMNDKAHCVEYILNLLMGDLQLPKIEHVIKHYLKIVNIILKNNLNILNCLRKLHGIKILVGPAVLE